MYAIMTMSDFHVRCEGGHHKTAKNSTLTTWLKRSKNDVSTLKVKDIIGLCIKHTADYWRYKLCTGSCVKSVKYKLLFWTNFLFVLTHTVCNSFKSMLLFCYVLVLYNNLITWFAKLKFASLRKCISFQLFAYQIVL